MFNVKNKSNANGGKGNNNSASINNTPPAKIKSGLLKNGERILFFNLLNVGLSNSANCLFLAKSYVNLLLLCIVASCLPKYEIYFF